VQPGDTLSKIAKKYYGDPNLYTQIFEANRDILNDPNLIQVGQKLRIP
jgi:nucleoid-associated protein YgaU